MVYSLHLLFVYFALWDFYFPKVVSAKVRAGLQALAQPSCSPAAAWGEQNSRCSPVLIVTQCLCWVDRVQDTCPGQLWFSCCDGRVELLQLPAQLYPRFYMGKVGLRAPTWTGFSSAIAWLEWGSGSWSILVVVWSLHELGGAWDAHLALLWLWCWCGVGGAQGTCLVWFQHRLEGEYQKWRASVPSSSS